MSSQPTTHAPGIDSLIDPALRDEIGDPLTILFTAGVVYTPLLLAAAALALYWQETLPGPLDSATLGAAAAAGFSLGLGMVAITWVLVRLLPSLRALESEFRTTLGPLSARQVLSLALLSGVTEEFFFRGVLQPWLGYWAASSVFGLVHFVPHKVYRPWTLFALAAGFMFGALYEWSGSLLAPIVAHVSVNAINLAIIVRAQKQR